MDSNFETSRSHFGRARAGSRGNLWAASARKKSSGETFSPSRHTRTCLWLCASGRFFGLGGYFRVIFRGFPTPKIQSSRKRLLGDRERERKIEDDRGRRETAQIRVSSEQTPDFRTLQLRSIAAQKWRTPYIPFCATILITQEHLEIFTIAPPYSPKK